MKGFSMYHHSAHIKKTEISFRYGEERVMVLIIDEINESKQKSLVDWNGVVDCPQTTGSEIGSQHGVVHHPSFLDMACNNNNNNRYVLTQQIYFS